MARTWEKIDHFTNEPYKKNPKSGAWNVVDYVSDDFRISTLPDGARELTKSGKRLKVFKTVKAAKMYAETLN